MSFFHAILSNSTQEEVYDEDFQALIDYVASEGLTAFTTEEKTAFNQQIIDLKAGGVWGERSRIYNLFDSDPVRSRINIKSPGTSDLSVVGTPTHTGGSGWNANTASGYLETGIDLSTLSDFLQNDAGVSCFLTGSNVAGTGIDFGVSDGTRQLVFNARNASDQVVFQINDFTNDTIGTQVDSRGWYSVNRTSSSAKRAKRNGTAVNAATRTSVGRPTGRTLTLLARQNNGTVGNHSARTMAYFSLGGSLTQNQEAAEYRAFFRSYCAINSFDFVVSDSPFEDPLIDIGGGVTWDATSVFGSTLPINNNSIIYYNGLDAASAPGDTREFEIGAFDLTSFTGGTKNVGNPIVTRTALSLTDASEGIMAFSTWIDGTDIYLFCALSQSDGTRDIVYLRGSTSDYYSFDTDIHNVITAGDFNHSPFVMEHPTDATKLLLFYSARTLSSDPLKIRVAEALKADVRTNTATWTVLDSDIVAGMTGTAGIVYPQVEYNNGTYTLFYSEGYANCGVTTFQNNFSQSEDFTSFPAGTALDVPFGDDGYDGGYKATPRATTGYIYQSGRDLLGVNGPYIGVSVKQLIRN